MFKILERRRGLGCNGDFIRFYRNKDTLIHLSVFEQIQNAIEVIVESKMQGNVNTFSTFDIEKSILEYYICSSNKKLANLFFIGFFYFVTFAHVNQHNNKTPKLQS